MPIALLITGVIVQMSDIPLWIQFSVGTLLLALSVNLLDWNDGNFLKLLSTPMLISIGTWSYSIYLWQQFFYWIAIRGPLWAVPAHIFGVFAVAVMSFYWVEQPVREYLNHRFR